MPGFAHLHVASGFSMRYGASMPEDLVERAAEHGQGALALTDRDGLYGAVRFATACGRAGIAPVLGVDLAVEPLVPRCGGRDTAAGHAARMPVARVRAAHPGARWRDRRPPAAAGHRAGPRPGWRHRPRGRLGRAVPAGHRDPPARRAGRAGHQPRPARRWSHPSDPTRATRTVLAPRGRRNRRQVARRVGEGGEPSRLLVLLGPDSDVGRAVLAGRRERARDLARHLAGAAARATGWPSRSSTTAGRRAPPAAARTRPTCSAWPTPPACPPCSPPRCATPTPSRCAPSTCSTPPAGSSCSTRATSTGSPTPATSPTPRRCTRAPSRSPAATAPAPTGWSR